MKQAVEKGESFSSDSEESKEGLEIVEKVVVESPVKAKP